MKILQLAISRSHYRITRVAPYEGVVSDVRKTRTGRRPPICRPSSPAPPANPSRLTLASRDQAQRNRGSRHHAPLEMRPPIDTPWSDSQRLAEACRGPSKWPDHHPG